MMEDARRRAHATCWVIGIADMLPGSRLVAAGAASAYL